MVRDMLSNNCISVCVGVLGRRALASAMEDNTPAFNEMSQMVF